MQHEKVLCMHCNQYVSRAQERAHRKLQFAPLYSPPDRIPSRLRRVFDVEENEHEMAAYGNGVSAGTDMVLDRWNLDASGSGSDEEGSEFSSSTQGDSDVEGNFNYEAFESQLSAWDQLGEGYERDAANIAEKLSSYDLAICRAFSYKVQTHTTDKDFEKLPYAFPSDNPLPKIDTIRSRVTFLAGFKPEFYDHCPDACCCFVGPYANLSKCPFCQQTRYRPDGKPRQQYTYIPIIPRLVALMANRRTAEQMRYRAHIHQHVPGTTTDIFDGSHYRSLRRKHVELQGQKLAHRYFDDHRDIALGLSADGFAPFKRRTKTIWAFILFNYNLPPDTRFHIHNILALGAVGPKKPVDADSFLWPAVQEFLRLLVGVRAFDILSSEIFVLRAFLLLVFGDIPAISLLMNMKGHSGISPCRMCNIIGLQIPESRRTSHYVPLMRSSHPDVKSSRDAVKVFDAHNLPLRTHDEIMSRAHEVQNTLTNTEAVDLSKEYGIKGISILSYLPSITFPLSFPYDFMHLIWENVIPNLVLLWTGEYKKLGQGSEEYQIPKAVWDAVGEATATSGSSIPSAYGCRISNIAKGTAYFSAEMWSFWTMYIGPVVLRRRFQRPKYYIHFVHLVRLLNICLQFELTEADTEEIRIGFIRWVKEYENIYYQNKPERLSTCPVTIHALLHIAESIKATGPVWCYWAFPMERFCGSLQPGIRSRRYPSASLDRYITESSQLKHIAMLYNIADILALRPPPGPMATVRGGFSHPEYPTCVLLPPMSRIRPADNLMTAIASALATRFDANIGLVRQYLVHAVIEEWGKVRRIDSDAGDTMQASSLRITRDDTRDATYVRYEMLIDRYARQPLRRSEHELQTFYGQLQHIYVIQFPEPLRDLGLAVTIILAAVRTCILDKPDPQLRGLDIHFSSNNGALHVIDITSIQCLVGRIRDRDRWAIIDRSGHLARALYVEEID